MLLFFPQVIKLILLREGYVKRLRAQCKQLQQGSAAAAEPAPLAGGRRGVHGGSRSTTPAPALLPAVVVEVQCGLETFG